MTNKYTLLMVFDHTGDPPRIYVKDPEGSRFAEIFIEPIPLVEEPDTFNDEHWEFPDVAKRLASLLNQYA